MKYRLWRAVTFAALAGHACLAQAQPRYDSHEVITMSLRDDMIGKARLNGEVVTGVALKGRCLSGFTTRRGTTWIDWSKTDNGYPDGTSDHLILRIPRNGTFEVITYDGDPDVANRIVMSTGLLLLDCQKAVRS